MYNQLEPNAHIDLEKYPRRAFDKHDGWKWKKTVDITFTINTFTGYNIEGHGETFEVNLDYMRGCVTISQTQKLNPVQAAALGVELDPHPRKI
jgi:hypothetical protein